MINTIILNMLSSVSVNPTDELKQLLHDVGHPKMNSKQLFDAIVLTLVDNAKYHPEYLDIASRLTSLRAYKEVYEAYPDLKYLSVGPDDDVSELNVNRKYFIHPSVIQNNIRAYFGAYLDRVGDDQLGLMSDEFNRKALEYLNSVNLKEIVSLENDYLLSYIGAKQQYDRYLTRDDKILIELPQFMWLRVAIGLNLLETDNFINMVNDVYRTMSNFDYMHSTATLFNAGLKTAQLSSCFKLNIEDDASSIMEAMSDAALISKYSGGLSLNFMKVRARGSFIKGTGGESNGVVPFMRITEVVAQAYNQGGKRPGSMCNYLPIWHADYPDFLDLRKEVGDHRQRTHDVNTASWIPDLFMKRVIEEKEWSLFSPDETPLLSSTYGDEFEEAYQEYESLGKAGKLRVYHTMQADSLFKTLLNALFTTGHPWPCFSDAHNHRYANQHVDIVTQSNLCCITGDQRCATDEGLITAKDLYLSGRLNKVVGMTGFENATQMFLPRPSAPILKVLTAEGYTHRVTPDHPLWVKGYGWVEAQHLVAGQKLLIQQIEGMFGNISDLGGAYQLGLAVGYDTDSSTSHIPDLVWKGTRETVKAYLRGVYEMRSHINIHSNVLELSTSNLEWLDNLQILWANFGVKTYITVQTPHISNGAPSYTLSIRYGYNGLVNEVIDQSVFTLDSGKDVNYAVFVGAIPDGVEDTYCLTVHTEQHAWTANGLLTKNTEISLHTNDKETAVCNLASINAANMVNPITKQLDLDKIIKTTKLAVRMLDNVIDLNYYTDAKTQYANIHNRPIGLGIKGVHECFMIMGIPYSSEEALEITELLHRTMCIAGMEASIELAKERGVYPNYYGSLWSKGYLIPDTLKLLKANRGVYGKDIPDLMEDERYAQLRADLKQYGIRNGQLFAIAPTASISNFSGTTQSIEPVYEQVYVRSNLSGEFISFNRQLVRILKERNLWSEDTVDEIIDSKTLKDTSLPLDIKQLCESAFEIDPLILIKHNAIRQGYIDQAISFNIYQATPNGRKLLNTYKAAWSHGLKTTYYLRSLSATSLGDKKEPTPSIMEMTKVRIETNPLDEVIGKACLINDPSCEACQ